MLPTEEQIRHEAHRRWEERGRMNGNDLFDWYSAERALRLFLNYQPILFYELSAEPKVYLGNRSPRRCRYCGRGEEATFQITAHAIPESIGNRRLIALDECDDCNKYFSETLEDSLGKFLLPFRTLLGIPGKKGVPSFKSRDKLTRIDFDSAKQGFHAIDPRSTLNLQDDIERKQFNITVPTQKYVPVLVLKCLVKMALAVLPHEELPYFDSTIRWLLNPNPKCCLEYMRGAGCYKYFIPEFVQKPWVSLLRRTNTDNNYPHMLFLVSSAGLILQTCLPLSSRDLHLASGSTDVPPFAGFHTDADGKPEVEMLRLDSAEPVEANVDFTIHYRTREEREKDS